MTQSNYEELYHHGIKGQRWGIRRYQNKDGTLTAAGQKRYKKEIKRDFSRSDKQYTSNATRKYYETNDQLFKDAFTKVKAANSKIGAVVQMTDGRSYTSSDAIFKIKQGLHVEKIRWICYGDTLSETMNMLDTVTKFGNDENFRKAYNQYKDDYVEGYLKDAGKEISDVGKKLVDEILNNKH